MSVPVVAFFNNKGGVGKTSLVYHLAWMFSELGLRIVAADLDPQSNLTAAFIDEDKLALMLPMTNRASTVYRSLRPVISGIGDIASPELEIIHERLALIPGDMQLSSFEDQLSESWPKCLAGDERSFRVTSAFWRLLQKAAEQFDAAIVMVDLGPNLGAINRAALIGSDYVVIPLGPDLFSLQGLENLGPALRRWRTDWADRRAKNPATDLPLPAGRVEPIGYMVIRHSIRLDRPVQAFDRWIAKIPQTYQQNVLHKSNHVGTNIDTDPNCIAKLKDYRSLMPLAQEARKPMFYLKYNDGAIGAHTSAVAEAYKDFHRVACEIARRMKIELPLENRMPV